MLSGACLVPGECAREMGRKRDFHKQLDLLEGLPQWISLMSEWLAVRTGLPEEEEAKEGSSPGPPFNSVELSGSKKGAQGAPKRGLKRPPKNPGKGGFGEEAQQGRLLLSQKRWARPKLLILKK